MRWSRGWLGAAAIALPSPFALAACGEEGTADDAETVRALLRSSAATQRTMAPLYQCLPEQPSCYTDAGPTIETTLEAARRRFGEVLEETDNDCLRKVGDLYAKSLDAYLAAGRAASAGDHAGVDEAIASSTEYELAYFAQLDACGFAQGREREFGVKFRELNSEFLEIGNEMEECLDPACLDQGAIRLEEAAARGVALLEGGAEQLFEDPPSCLVLAFDKFEEGYRTLQSAARAIQNEKFKIAKQQATEASELLLQGQDAYAACLT